MNIGENIICYNNESVSDILSVGNSYKIENITADGLLKLQNIEYLFLDWRFIPASLDSEIK